jgi:hypothetical protein
MPRRIPDYAMQFTGWNISSIGGWVYGAFPSLYHWSLPASAEVLTRPAQRLVDPYGGELLGIKLQ